MMRRFVLQRCSASILAWRIGSEADQEITADDVLPKKLVLQERVLYRATEESDSDMSTRETDRRDLRWYVQRWPSFFGDWQ